MVVFGDGEGLVTTVRVRVEGDCVVVEEFEFCPNTRVAHEITIKVATRILLNMNCLLTFAVRTACGSGRSKP